MIDLNNISKIFGSTIVALQQVSFSVKENEFFTLLGPSGCGKTTLLRIIAGFEFPDSGDVLLDGNDISSQPPEKRSVNTVFQNYALFPHMSVLQNVAFGMEMRGITRAESLARAQQMLKSVMLDEFSERLPAQLSGGQQQRVALARALTNQPRVLLLDEPLSALDYKLRKTMRSELKRLQRDTGITFIFVTHDQDEALTMSDRVAVMCAGEVRQLGTPIDIYEKPADRFVADFIGETNFLEGTATISERDAMCVTLRDGTVLTAQGKRPATDSAVTLAIRPERIKLTHYAEAGANSVAGIVDDVVYQGNTTRYQISLKSGDSIAALEVNATTEKARFLNNDAVRVHFKEQSLWLLEK